MNGDAPDGAGRVKPGLAAAYALKTPEDSVRLYESWAESYDADFAEANAYTYPEKVAEIFHDMAGGAAAPVLDVGAGTGLVGAALARLGTYQTDALDISAAMLKRAMHKGCYRAALQADLTGKLGLACNTYAGVTSAGTFTHGHVGPKALDELLRITRPGGLLVLGINAELYDSAGFAANLADMSASLANFRQVDVPIYGPDSPPDMQNARACVVVFNKV